MTDLMTLMVVKLMVPGVLVTPDHFMCVRVAFNGRFWRIHDENDTIYINEIDDRGAYVDAFRTFTDPERAAKHITSAPPRETRKSVPFVPAPMRKPSFLRRLLGL